MGTPARRPPGRARTLTHIAWMTPVRPVRDLRTWSPTGRRPSLEHEELTPMTPTLQTGPAPALLTEQDAELLLTGATRAPSLHNTQPWAFAVGSRHVELYADASRQLPRSDPSGRALLISCGAALFNLRVAAGHLGLHPRVRLLPDDDDPTLVALLEVDHRHHRPASIDHYFPALPERRTNRLPFSDRRFPPSVVGRLVEAATVEGAMLRVYDDPAEVTRLLELLHAGDR